MKRIDAHHHFWKYDPVEYGWITDELNALRRDFLPGHLGAEIAKAGIDQVVSVQARQSIVETDWLLTMAGENDFIAGVVGWLPLVDPGLPALLDGYAGREKLKAVRHVLQDEPDDDYMLRDDFNRGLGRLAAHGLAYDILIFERHLPQAIQLVDRHPNQVFVVNHVAKPRIHEGILSPWRERIIELGKRENVSCKLSGMVTEADWESWTEEQLQPYIDTVLEAFGPRRLMFGTDWPVCTLACQYRRWVGVVTRATARLSPAEREMIFGGAASAAYRLA